MVQGSGIDAPLNETGIAQARAFYNAYSHLQFDKIYTSTLQRTIQSVQFFIDAGIPYESLSGLNEINWGSKEGMPFNNKDSKYYFEVTSSWQKGDVHLSIGGGESPLDVFSRQEVALKHILSNEKEQEILICMHGRAMRIFLCMMLNYDLRNMDVFEHANLCLYQVVYTGQIFSVETFNETNHLNGIAT